MKAILIQPAEHLGTLELCDINAPTTGPLDVRVAVRAGSVNRADLLTRAGTHKVMNAVPGPAIAGLDVAGEIVEVGDQVRGFTVGNRVMAMVSGGLAEEVVIPAAMAIPVPTAWTWQEGAAAVIGLMTEHNALVTAGRFVPGSTVLIHAVGSGVGIQAVQLARHLGAGLVVGTSRSSGGEEMLRGLGLDELVVTTATNFADRVGELTDGRGADIIVDHVGGPYLPDNIRAAAVRGRIVGVGRLGGAEGTLDMEELARKRIEIIGVTFRTRTPIEKAAVVAGLRDDVDLESAADSLRPLIDRTLPWTDVLEAQTLMAHNQHFGKIVLNVGQ